MTKRLDHYRLSRDAIARCRCNDCGVNVIEIGDYCMLNSDIWEDAFGLGWDDNLCLACVEQRLGRKLTIGDFIGFPSVAGYPMSETLADRWGIEKALARQKARKQLARRKASETYR